MTLKNTIYYILLNQPETRNSRALLKWEVLKDKGFVKSYSDRNELVMSKEDFIKWETDTVRRCSQALQRTDLLSGAKLIQPTKTVKENRVKLAKSKGFEYQEGNAVYNPFTNCYEY